ncbi:acetyl-CoA C-acetyltransferase [Georgenia ruanii]|uniref:acetyl-CoA C-acyltransferase n=1 Tax=Georgenia ruanii TaxID=348442 RepID=A0A7J9UXR1_9MICO|nr:acetyl-CoA C-acetyltransferase [Georgenia ruanii]MPV88474.1 acetyl-CoA C-acetyltransferase [Georgenia ruanii]
MPEAVIVSTARSPIGRATKGSLTHFRPDDLAATIVREALAKVPELDPADVEDLMLGCAQPAGEAGYNLARAVAVLAGLDTVPGTTVNRYCASSLQTTRMALHAIRAGEGSVFISAGVETVSRYVHGKADGLPGTHNPVFDEAQARSAQHAEAGGAWSDPRSAGSLPNLYLTMGQTAENVAQLRNVSRADQDEFAALSQQRAARALAEGFWAREITPVPAPDGHLITADDGPRPGVTIEGLAALQPVFRTDGTVTAGNCCALNDGAAALVIMSADRASELGVRPLARIVSTGVSGISPEIMGLGPVESSRKALRAAGMTIRDVDLVEMNEAFAAQVIPSARELEVDPETLNVHGGAIAVGHPFGMTGARLVTTLVNGLEWSDKEIGLATLCVGGGQGMALVLQRL